MIGKLLARFYLHKKTKDKSDDNEKKIRDFLLSFQKKSLKFDVTFSIIGLRNLVSTQRSSKIRVSFTQHLFSLKQETTKGETTNDDD